MKYCVIKGTIRDIAQSDNEEKLIESALTTEVDGELLKDGDFEILSKEEYQARKALEPIIPQPPTEIELLQAENQKLQEQITQNDLTTAEAVITLYEQNMKTELDTAEAVITLYEMVMMLQISIEGGM